MQTSKVNLKLKINPIIKDAHHNFLKLRHDILSFIFLIFTLCKMFPHISSKVASHCRDQTSPFPLFKRHPVCKQSIMGPRGDFQGGRQFAQPLNIMLSHCTALHVVIPGEKQDAPLPIYRRNTHRCFPLQRIL